MDFDRLSIPVDYYIQIYEIGYYNTTPDESVPHFGEVYKSVMYTLGRLSEILPSVEYLEKIVKIMISNHLIISTVNDKPYFMLHTSNVGAFTFCCCDILDFKAFVISHIRYNILRNIRLNHHYHFLLSAHSSDEARLRSASESFSICESEDDVNAILSSISTEPPFPGGPRGIDGGNLDMNDINKVDVGLIPKFILRKNIMNYQSWLTPHFEIVARYHRTCLIFIHSIQNIKRARDEMWMIDVIITLHPLTNTSYPLSSMIDLSNEKFTSTILYPIIYDEDSITEDVSNMLLYTYVPEICKAARYSNNHNYANWFTSQNPGGLHCTGYVGNVEDEKLLSILFELSTYDSESKTETKQINISNLNIETSTPPTFEEEDGIECSVCMDIIQHDYLECSKCKTFICKSCFDKCKECPIGCGSESFTHYI